MRKIGIFSFIFAAVVYYCSAVHFLWADWTSLTSGSSFSLNSIHFVDTSNGWSVGASGAILYTSNGGSSWSAQTSGTSKTLRDVRFHSTVLGWAVGDDGVILKTSNGGTNWQSKTSGITDSLNGLFSTDASNVWAVGATGKVRKSSNGGNSWSSQDPGTSNGLRSIFFINTSTGWIVGDSGTIRKTVNGGSSWSSMNSPTGNNLKGVYFVNESTGYTVGDSGTILKSTNSGVTWSALASGVAANLNSLFFSSGTRGWVVGDSGNTRTTFDGTNWSADGNASGNTNALRKISVVSPSQGYASGDSGTILKSTNNAPSTYAIQGKVINSTGAAIPSATVTLSGSASASQVTPSNGTYEFSGLSAGDYTVSVSSTGFSFNPVSRSFSKLNTIQDNQDFQGSTVTTLITLSGTVKKSGSGISGVKLTLTGMVSGEALSGSNGAYSFVNIPTGTYTITPSKTGYTFSPTNRSYSSIQASQTTEDYDGTPFFTIEGFLTLSSGSALAGWAVNLTGTSSTTATTDVEGYYSFSSLAEGNYTIQPATQTGFSFSPISRSTTSLSADLPNQNFIRSSVSTNTYKIGGTIVDASGLGVSSVTVVLSGSASGSVVTSTTGVYEFASLSSGSYTITPSTDSNFSSFSPSSISTTPLTSDATGLNFVATTKASVAATVTVQPGSIRAINNLFDPTKNENTTIQYSVDNEGPTLIRIFNMQGRLVRTLFEGVQTVGTFDLPWNGKNDDGEIVASGIYVVHIHAPRISLSYKIAVVQ